MIPTFALERTQEVLYELNYLHETRQIPKVPVYLDSPLAIDALDIYKRYTHLFDAEAKERINSGDALFNFAGLELARTAEQSKRINRVAAPKVILAGSGMANGGRIMFHLKLYLPDSKSQLLIISYQAEGSLGRLLKDGAKRVTIDGEKVAVKAKIIAIGSYSSHADQPKLLHWLKSIDSPKPKMIFVNHGEGKSSLMLTDGIRQKLGVETIIPERDQRFTI